MWVAIVLIMFIGSDGRINEQQFTSRETYVSANECLAQAGQAVIASLPEADNVRAFAVACSERPGTEV